MDLIKQVKGFRMKRADKPISANAICLYYILLEYNNELYFTQWFTLPNSLLTGLTSLSLKSFQRARNELVQKEYIQYKNGKGNQSGSYSLVDLSVIFDQQSVQQLTNNMTNNMSNNMSNSWPSKRPHIYTIQDNTKQNQTKKEKGTRTSTPKEKFVEPSVEEVRAYCMERKNGVDAQRFVDFYAATGWYRGKNKIKDWKAAVRTWEQREKEREGTERTTCSQEDIFAIYGRL